jgi:ribosomal protein L11 methyltransferase
MIQHILFEIPKLKSKQAKVYLESFTSHPLYELKEKNKIFVGGFFEQLPSDLPDFLQNYTNLDVDIDWTSQWQSFSPHFNNQNFELDLSSYGIHKVIFLQPGPGFGDLSHPTTKLCLKHMAKLCRGHVVIDFGCGSGILSVAAWVFGAYKVISLEIDGPSIEHTKSNLALNHFPTDFVYESMPPLIDESDSLCIINMTFGEQKVALKPHVLPKKPIRFLSSGILKTQKEDYILWGKTLGVNFEVLDELEGWLVFQGSN